MDASQWMSTDGGFGHMDGWGGGWMWVWGTLMMVLTLLALVWLVRTVSGRNGAAPPNHLDQARTILAERYARGELTTEEYRERLDHLV